MSILEETIDIVREDGAFVPGVRLIPEFDRAERCSGAGVVVLGGERGLGPAERARFLMPLADIGYFVIGLDLVRGRVAGPEEGAQRAAGLDHLIAIDDLVGALLTLKQLASGKLGVIGIGLGAAIALEAATQIPHIDAVVHVDGPPPSASVKLARLRAPVHIHRALYGTLMPAGVVADLRERATRGRAQFLVDEYPTGDGFFVHPADDDEAFHARVAWDKTRDFLNYALL